MLQKVRALWFWKSSSNLIKWSSYKKEDDVEKGFKKSKYKEMKSKR